MDLNPGESASVVFQLEWQRGAGGVWGWYPQGWHQIPWAPWWLRPLNVVAGRFGWKFDNPRDRW